MVPYVKVLIIMDIEKIKKSQAKYEAEKVESIRFRVPKGKKLLIQECAKKNNESVNSMLNRLVNLEIERILD